MPRIVAVVALGFALGATLAARDGSSKGNRRAIAVIVHPNNPVGDISLADLGAIFRKDRKTWPGGGKALPLNWNPRTPARVAFDRHVLKMSPDESAAYWIDQRIRGRGDPPRALGSAATIQAIVSRQEEAVAYIPLEQVESGVKIVAVSGVRPGDAGYAIPAEQ